MIRIWCSLPSRLSARAAVAASAAALVAAVAMGAAGCDPNAKAGENDRLSSARERLSRAWETCSSSLDCADGLRCFQTMCRDTTTSVMGDYQAAVGARALARGNYTDAVRAYSDAVTQYQAEAEVPVWLYCDLGHALTAASDDPDYGERAARALHRCIREVPSGAAARTRAMTDLAVLGDMGLDPVRLKLAEDAEKYLTKGPKRPPSDKVAVSVTSDAKRKPGSHQKLVELLESSELRTALLPCWEAHWAATREGAMKVTIPLRYAYQQGEYEEDDRYVLKFEGDAPSGTTPEAQAQACVRAAVEAATADFSKRAGGGAWTAGITIALE